MLNNSNYLTLHATKGNPYFLSVGEFTVAGPGITTATVRASYSELSHRKEVGITLDHHRMVPEKCSLANVPYTHILLASFPGFSKVQKTLGSGAWEQGYILSCSLVPRFFQSAKNAGQWSLGIRLYTFL